MLEEVVVLQVMGIKNVFVMIRRRGMMWRIRRREERRS